jgi:hypothetical protein
VGADSTSIVNLARVGKGRALLGLGRYADAAQMVADVPDGFQYAERYASRDVTEDATNFAEFHFDVQLLPWFATVPNREGGTGLDYRSSADPRTVATFFATNGAGVDLYHPDKYATDGSSAIVLGDWVEARLIEAEAALQAGDTTTWLAKLNHLRQTAISPPLPDTTDPGSPNARVDLLFRERAFWLFLTGHRQGDLRRLMRQYGRQAIQVYPTGVYPGGLNLYGDDVTAPIPAAEREFNPKFAGCIGRGA